MTDNMSKIMMFVYILVSATVWLVLSPFLFTGVGKLHTGNILAVTSAQPTTWPCLLAIWFGASVLFRYTLSLVVIVLPLASLAVPRMRGLAPCVLWVCLWTTMAGSLISLLGFVALAMGG